MKIIHHSGNKLSISESASLPVSGSRPQLRPDSESVEGSEPVTGSVFRTAPIPYLALLVVIPVFMLFSFVADSDSVEDPRESFLKNYTSYCGNSYAGKTRYIDLGDNHPLEGASLLMEIRECSENSVRIPFIVNSDSSRTWILMNTPQGLYFTHDHRYPDGTQYANNFYGGYADESGTAVKQFFPADHRTVLDRPVRSANVWSIEFDHEEESYFYRLYLDGELRYVAVFDLSTPVE
jgi:hypothetical protein